MTDSTFDSDRTEVASLSQEDMRTISKWLDTAPVSVSEELTALQGHLATLRACTVTPQLRSWTLGRLFERSVSVSASLHPSLISVSLPIPGKIRQMVRGLQNILQALAEDLAPTTENSAENPPIGLPHVQDIDLWRSLYALAQHLLISNLVASPAGVGIWKQLHQTYDMARRLLVTGNTPRGASSSLQHVYSSAILLGCAQPASFTSQEVILVADYLDRFANLIDLGESVAVESDATFWLDSARDAAPIPCSRKPAVPEVQVHYFSCDRLAAHLRSQLTALQSGSTPQQINLPEFAETPAGQGVLRRLVTYWGEPGKRQFPRRRQSYRAVLCAGLDSLWRLFNGQEHLEAAEASNWMITNESPNGYAVMHVSGKTGNLSVGDITAIRIEPGENWQICIVRWALSENQEHLEIGLQILATHAVPAFLALPATAGDRSGLSVLILPRIKTPNSAEMLVVPSGALDNQSQSFVLVVEKENIEVREVRSTHLDEQNSHIEVFSIEPDTLPA
jgi:hypothetical protein